MKIKHTFFLLISIMFLMLFSCDDTPPPPTQAPTPTPTIPGSCTVSDSFGDVYNGIYIYTNSFQNGKPAFEITIHGDLYRIYWNNVRQRWELSGIYEGAADFEYYHPSATDFLPPETGWFFNHPDEDIDPYEDPNMTVTLNS